MNSPQQHPAAMPPLIGLARLARLAFSAFDFTDMSAQLLERATNNAQDANAFLDLSTILHLTGWRDLGMEMQREALALQNVFQLLPQSGVSNLRVLVFLSPGDLAENNAIEFLLEAADITLDFFYFTPQGLRPETNRDDYDLAFVAVCESDQNRPLLAAIDDFLTSWTLPVLNSAQHIARLTRDHAHALLPRMDNVQFPITVRLLRDDLSRIADGTAELIDLLPDGAYPVIVRPVDSHKGKGLACLDDHHALHNYMTTQDGGDFYLSRFVDYRSADGSYTKYRIVLIDGKPFVCHMAISDHWMVHYMSAGMTQSAIKRDQEAEFMRSFDDSFAIRHAGAFAAIFRALELDYVGMDCGENAAGELVLFEFDSGMTVHAMDPVELFPYKQPQMRKVFSAFRQLLINAANRSKPE
jgi:glutathione synthase/RimK-type ligase-like ATP-grasp enzyme